MTRPNPTPSDVAGPSAKFVAMTRNPDLAAAAVGAREWPKFQPTPKQPGDVVIGTEWRRG